MSFSFEFLSPSCKQSKKQVSSSSWSEYIEFTTSSRRNNNDEAFLFLKSIRRSLNWKFSVKYLGLDKKYIETRTREGENSLSVVYHKWERKTSSQVFLIKFKMSTASNMIFNSSKNPDNSMLDIRWELKCLLIIFLLNLL